jgi:hypothetical protein
MTATASDPFNILFTSFFWQLNMPGRRSSGDLAQHNRRPGKAQRPDYGFSFAAPREKLCRYPRGCNRH